MLAEVVRRGTGAVRIVFQGQDGGHLRVGVSAAGPGRAEPRPASPSRASSRPAPSVEALGGRILGEDPARGLEVLLPRR